MTPLEKTLKRQLSIEGVEYVITLSPQSLKITVKNHRLGVELPWKELVSGESALAVALHASVGKFGVAPAPGNAQPAVTEAPAVQGQGGSGDRIETGRRDPVEATPVPQSNAKAKARPSNESKGKTKKQKGKLLKRP